MKSQVKYIREISFSRALKWCITWNSVLFLNYTKHCILLLWSCALFSVHWTRNSIYMSYQYILLITCYNSNYSSTKHHYNIILLQNLDFSSSIVNRWLFLSRFRLVWNEFRMDLCQSPSIWEGYIFTQLQDHNNI